MSYGVNVSYVLNDAADVKYEIFNMAGQLILTQNDNANSGVIIETIDINALSSGLYMMRISVENQQITKKFNVNR